MAKTALLIIDIQKGLFQRSIPIYKEEEFLNNINILENKARLANVPVIYIQHDNQSFLKKNTEGWELHPQLNYRNGDLLIYKNQGNAFKNTVLKIELDKCNVTNLLITGLVSQGCVKASCIGAKELGYNVILIKDGHTNFNKNAEFLISEINREMKKAGINIVNTEQLII